MTGGAVSRCREAGDGRDLLADGGGAGAGDRVAQILNSKSSKGTLLQFDGEAVEAAEVKHTTEMLLMRGQKVAENQYIVKIDKTKRKLTKDPVHHSLEGLGSVLEAKRGQRNSKRLKGVRLAVFEILAGLIGCWK